MPSELDNLDRAILRALQKDAAISMDALAERVALSRNACWRRVKRLEADGVLTGRTALIDPQTVGLGLSVFVLIRTNQHGPDWLRKFKSVVSEMPEIVGAHRMSSTRSSLLAKSWAWAAATE